MLAVPVDQRVEMTGERREFGGHVRLPGKFAEGLFVNARRGIEQHAEVIETLRRAAHLGLDERAQGIQRRACEMRTERGEARLVALIVFIRRHRGEPRTARRHEGLRTLRLEILAVHPAAFLHVELRIVVIEMLPVEERLHVRDGHDLAVILGRPAEQAEIIPHRLRNELPLHVKADRRALVALAHLGAVRVQNEREVRKLRQRRPQRVEQLDVLAGIIYVIFAAHDVRDLHRDVVHHIYEMKNVAPVRAAQRHVRLDAAVNFDVPADPIREHDGLARRTKTNRAILLGVSVPRRGEPLQILRINVLALTLKVRPESAARLRPFVPVNAQPAQPVEDRTERRRRIARGIRVFDAEHERPAPVPREEPVEQRRARPAGVEITGGRGSETNARSSAGHGHHANRSAAGKSSLLTSP